ncbi:MAG: hypothetical protein WD556_02615 [Actinomycetota bacterium]
MSVHSLADLPLVITIPELADALRWSRSAAYDWARSHPEDVIRVNRSIRVPRRVVAELIGEGVPPHGDGDAA